MKFIKSKKYTGIYHYELKGGDKTFYVVYKINGKTERIKIGKASEGINEAYCHQKRNEFLQKERLGEVIPLKDKKQTSLTLNDLANRFFEDKKHRIKNIERDYVSRYAYKIKDKLGTSQASQITKNDIENLQKILADDGLANTTANWYTDLIRAIFNHALEKELFKGSNPASKIKPLKVNNDRERFLSKDEAEMLKKEVENVPPLSIFVYISLCTGGRLETILSIQKKDINLENSTINLTDHKNGSSYKGFIDLSTLDLVKNRCEELKGNNDYLVSLDGTRLNARKIQNRLKPILDRLFNVGLDTRDAKNRVVIHTLRHTFASLLAIQGTPILTIQKLMNHKDIEMTLRYAKLSPDNGRSEVVKLWE